VQGADGVQLEWNPLAVSELPSFVYNRARGHPNAARVLLAKTAFVCRQRLETPVIYFHSDRPRTIDVSVRFPGGTMTEWFPRDTPAAKGARLVPALHWPKVSIIPRETNAADRLAALLPRESRGSHYYAAREADADFLQVADANGKLETEKFLFYRGIGNFEAPLKVTLPGKDAGVVGLRNTGAHELRHLFLTRVHEGLLTFSALPPLAPGASIQATVDSSPEDGRAPLAAQLRSALVASGLFASEAAAMVKTWEDSWLAESGIRVLYVLPTAWADAILPLKIEPAPKAIARVMVGRAEILTPTQEIALAAELQRFATGDESTRADAIAKGRALGLGRFLEAATRRVVAAHPQDKALASATWAFLEAATAPDRPLKTAQAKIGR